MPTKDPEAKADTGRYAVTATNHATGETWSIHDTLSVCERELNAKLADWTVDGQVIHVTTSGPTRLDG